MAATPALRSVVCIEQRNIFAPGKANGSIAGGCQSTIFLANILNIIAKVGGYFATVVGRPIIKHDDLARCIGLGDDAFDCFAQIACMIVIGNDNAD